MILSDTRILEEIEKGTIKIVPYDRACLGSNSYDIHLGKWLATYREHILDAKKHNEIEYFEIPEEGFVLYPHIFYLGVTHEYTETHAHVPFLEGKSSTGRLGIDIPATAARETLVSVATGRSRSPSNSLSKSTKACPSA